MFRWRRSKRRQTPAPAPLVDLVAELVPDDLEAAVARRSTERDRALTVLRRIVDEAVVRQDQAEELLYEIRDRGPLAPLSRRGAELMRRFLALRADLPLHDADPVVRAHAVAVGEVLHHHTLMLSTSLDALAVDWRSERIVRLLEELDGLGPPARRLDAIRHELLLLR